MHFLKKRTEESIFKPYHLKKTNNNSNKNLTQNGTEIKIWKITPLDVKEITQNLENIRFSNESNKFLYVIKADNEIPPLFVYVYMWNTHTDIQAQIHTTVIYTVTHKTSIHIYTKIQYMTLFLKLKLPVLQRHTFENENENTIEIRIILHQMFH